MVNTTDFISDLVTYLKYSHYIPSENRKETWDEIIDRVLKLFSYKIDQYDKVKNNSINKIFFYEVLSKLEYYIKEKYLLPSMRALQFASEPIIKKNHRIFNCTYKTINDFNAFHEIFYLLLLGCGVGFSVQKHHINQLNSIAIRTQSIEHIIEDSIEGWCDAIQILFDGANYGFKVSFNYQKIRPAGIQLKSSIGYSQGPEILKKNIDLIDSIIAQYEGKSLTTIACHDIVCILASTIVGGGTRRSALLSIFSKDDEQMFNAKRGMFYNHYPYRVQSNNSVYLDKENTSLKEFKEIMLKIKANNTGEPGFIWTNDFDLGYNPCCEVSLKDKGVCNLISVNTSKFNELNYRQINEVFELAGFLGILQSMFNKTDYLPIEYHKVAKDESLLGISLMGIQDIQTDFFPNILNKQKESEFFRDAIDSIFRGVDTFNFVANYDDYNFPKRATCIKPDGTTSLLCGTTHGISPLYSEYYIRRIRSNKYHGIVKKMLEENSKFIEKDMYNKNDYVISVPVHKKNYLPTTAMEELNQIKIYNKWIKEGHIEGKNTHNISYTLQYNNENYDDIINELYESRDYYNGISLFPEDNNVYMQAPYEKINKDQYNILYKNFKPIEFTDIKEEHIIYNELTEIACSGNACTI